MDSDYSSTPQTSSASDVKPFTLNFVPQIPKIESEVTSEEGETGDIFNFKESIQSCQSEVDPLKEVVSEEENVEGENIIHFFVSIPKVESVDVPETGEKNETFDPLDLSQENSSQKSFLGGEGEVESETGGESDTFSSRKIDPLDLSQENSSKESVLGEENVMNEYIFPLVVPILTVEDETLSEEDEECETSSLEKGAPSDKSRKPKIDTEDEESETSSSRKVTQSDKNRKLESTDTLNESQIDKTSSLGKFPQSGQSRKLDNSATLNKSQTDKTSSLRKVPQSGQSRKRDSRAKLNKSQKGKTSSSKKGIRSNQSRVDQRNERVLREANKKQFFGSRSKILFQGEPFVAINNKKSLLEAMKCAFVENYGNRDQNNFSSSNADVPTNKKSYEAGVTDAHQPSVIRYDGDSVKIKDVRVLLVRLFPEKLNMSAKQPNKKGSSQSELKPSSEKIEPTLLLKKQLKTSVKGTQTCPEYLDEFLDEKKLSCKQCPEQLHQKTDSYLKSTHCSEDRFSCNFCVSEFKDETNLKKHMKDHSDARLRRQKGEKVTCAICSKQFNRKTNLILHLESHFNSVPKFKPESNLKSHNHSTIYSCGVCSKGFKQKKRLKRHLSMHYNENPPSSGLCPSKAKPRHTLQSHEVHKTKTLDQYPEKSKKSSRPVTRDLFSASLKKRSKHKKDTLKTLFACSQCPAKFIKKRYLKSHLVNHSDLKPYRCKKCRGRFKFKSALTLHSRLHFDSRERRYCCKKCPAKYFLRQHLNRHLKATHSSERQYSCENCQSSFNTKDCLRSHMVIHSNKRPFSCSKCSATYKRKDHLTVHLKVHQK